MTILRTDWMAGNWGLMVHWLPPSVASEQGAPYAGFNETVNAFQVDRLIEQVKSTGAHWLIFTIGQNSALYASPNSVLDRRVGPGHASGRDLVLEIAAGMHAIGKRFIAYLPAEVDEPDVLHEGFAWNPADQTEFQRRYTDFIREYAVRYGKMLDGWWYDGTYTWPVFHNSLYDWDLWAEASRAGNPDAVLAFNDGSFCNDIQEPLCAQQDYLAGEIEVLREGKIRLGHDANGPLMLPTDRFAAGTSCQWHGLVGIDEMWMHSAPGPMPAPRFSDADLSNFVWKSLEVGGAITLNVGIYREGALAEATLQQIARLKLP